MIAKGEKHFVENLYFESSAIVMFFIEIGKYIENKNKNKTRRAIQKLVTITPKNATIIRNGAEYKVTIDEIQKGDIVICKPGEKIAVDGKVIDGVTHTDESFITGESLPVRKEIDSNVIAGSINYEGTIMYRAEKIGKESTVSEIVKLVTETTNTKPAIAKVADSISSYFVPIVLILAVISFVIWYLISKDIAYSINIFVSILVIACPCSLGLATPLAIVVSSGLCSQKGILVKSSVVLENAHKVRTICFDKTGTLTNGTLSISKIYKYTDESESEILKEVASIEKKSEHPIARAIVSYANELNIDLYEVSAFRSISGHGVYAKINEDEFFIGNRKFMMDNHIQIVNENDETELATKGNSILFVAKNLKLIALIGVKDVIRNNIKSVINSIKEKAEKIKELQQSGLVMMCGDGINDSVSLIASDIGVSISNGTDIAIDSADVVLMNDNLDKINDLILISCKTIKNIKQNLFWAFFYNICMIPIAAGMLRPLGIILNPMIAALAMTLSSLTVVLNALRLNILNKKEKV